MAMLLDFEEKWKTSFNVLYKHGLSWYEVLAMSLLVFDFAYVQMKQVRSFMH